MFTLKRFTKREPLIKKTPIPPPQRNIFYLSSSAPSLKDIIAMLIDSIRTIVLLMYCVFSINNNS
jgi:hypothetical protein